MPTKVPNLLINGASGIAVGMATNMASHNISEVIDGICAYIDENEITIDDLMKHITAPDFPTGGIIYGYDGVRDAFHTGRGRIVLRAKVNFEEIGSRNAIIVTEKAKNTIASHSGTCSSPSGASCSSTTSSSPPTAPRTCPTPNS